MDRNTFRLSLSERYLVGTPVLTFILYSGAELVLSAAVYLVYFLYSCTSAGCHFVCDETTVSIVTVVIISQDCEVFRLNWYCYILTGQQEGYLHRHQRGAGQEVAAILHNLQVRLGCLGESLSKLFLNQFLKVYNYVANFLNVWKLDE